MYLQASINSNINIYKLLFLQNTVHFFFLLLCMLANTHRLEKTLRWKVTRNTGFALADTWFELCHCS